MEILYTKGQRVLCKDSFVYSYDEETRKYVPETEFANTDEGIKANPTEDEMWSIPSVGIELLGEGYVGMTHSFCDVFYPVGSKNGIDLFLAQFYIKSAE